MELIRFRIPQGNPETLHIKKSALRKFSSPILFQKQQTLFFIGLNIDVTLKWRWGREIRFSVEVIMTFRAQKIVALYLIFHVASSITGCILDSSGTGKMDGPAPEPFDICMTQKRWQVCQAAFDAVDAGGYECTATPDGVLIKIPLVGDIPDTCPSITVCSEEPICNNNGSGGSDTGCANSGGSGGN